jgi:antitoxin HigA-1
MKETTAMFMRAVHPGEILKDELDALDITPTAFARQIEVPPNRVSQIVAGKRSVTGDTALRLGHWFGTEPQFWLNLQAQYDLVIADRETGEAVRHLPTRAALPPQGSPQAPLQG